MLFHNHLLAVHDVDALRQTFERRGCLAHHLAVEVVNVTVQLMLDFLTAEALDGHIFLRVIHVTAAEHVAAGGATLFIVCLIVQIKVCTLGLDTVGGMRRRGAFALVARYRGNLQTVAVEVHAAEHIEVVHLFTCRGRSVRSCRRAIPASSIRPE